MTILGGLIINGLAGFVFAVFQFPGRQFLFFVIVLSSLVPFEAISIPLYNVIKLFGWIDSYYALIIPGLANGVFKESPRPALKADRVTPVTPQRNTH